MRAVGGDRYEISQRRPRDVLPQLVYFHIRCLVIGSQFVNRAKHYSFHRRYGKGVVNACYFHKAIAMVGETWKNRFLTPFGDINILRHGSADILQHNHSDIVLIFGQVRILHFSKTQIDSCSGFHAGQFYFRYSHHILSHIINKYTGAYFFHREGGQFHFRFHCLAELSYQFKTRVIIYPRFIRVPFRTDITFQGNFTGRFPTYGIIGSRAPSFQPCITQSVIHFSLKKATVTDRAFIVILPGRGFGYYHFLLSVGVGDYQFCQ